MAAKQISAHRIVTLKIVVHKNDVDKVLAAVAAYGNIQGVEVKTIPSENIVNELAVSLNPLITSTQLMEGDVLDDKESD